MAVTDLETVQTIELGRQGENLATSLTFDLTEFVQTYGAGTAVLIHQRSGDTKPYIAETTQDNTVLTWPITYADTANSGTGAAEIRWSVNDVLKKSAEFNTSVTASIMDSTVEKPGNVVYMTAASSKMLARQTATEQMTSVNLGGGTDTDLLPDTDTFGKYIDGLSGYRYNLVIDSVTTAGDAFSATLSLINDTTVVYTQEITGSVELNPTTDFSQIWVMPHTEISSVTWHVEETSPIVVKLQQLLGGDS